MNIVFTPLLPAVDDVSNSSWNSAEPVVVSTYWSGETAPEGRRFEVRSLWNDTSLLVRFVANQSEPLVVSSKPVTSSKTIGLWDRDVCEIFIAPDASQPRRYFEFEIAPTGEWLDLGVHQWPDRRETDWEFESGMSAFGTSQPDHVTMTAEIPWSVFGMNPSAGDVWKGNLLRCVGEGETRGYLAWKPTMTSEPNFHAPEVFGDFRFVR